MRGSIVLLLAAILAAAALATTAGARSSYGRYYIDEDKVSNLIESKGFYYNGRRVAVDSSFCFGLRRYGVRSSEFGLDKYWRFKCDAEGANGHSYTLQVSTTTGRSPGYWYMHVLSAHLDF